MELDNLTLQPLIVNQLDFKAKAQPKRNLKLDVNSKISVQNISEHKSDMNRAIIRCDLSIQAREKDTFSLILNASAILECQIQEDGANFKELIEKQGVPRFMEQLRNAVANLTQNLGYSALKI